MPKSKFSLQRSTTLFALLSLSFNAVAWAVEAPVISPPSGAPPQAAPAPVVIPKLDPRPFSWTALPLNLPPSIKVYAGESVNTDGQLVRAWYADIDYSDRSLEAKSVLSRAASGRETTSALAKQVNALVAINGAYFSMTGSPAATYNTVISGGQVLAKNPWIVKRGTRDVYSTRGVFGVRRDRTFDISWIAHLGDKTYSYPTPLPNASGNFAPPPSETFPTGGKEWNDIQEAMGGGPVLVEGGEIKITAAEELFAGGHTTARHPRSAVGFNGAGRLILFAVDGRQPNHSMGMNLNELAQSMKELGCVEALNFDGGGSTSFVVNGQVLNKPSDGSERRVTAVFAVVRNPDLQALQSGQHLIKPNP